VAKPPTVSHRVAGAVLGAILLLAGALLTLYGLVAILYSGDSGGSGDTYVKNTYVKFSGHEIDADLAGAVTLVLACLVTVAAVAVLRVSRRSTRSR
jgi:ABC-type sugar transport system permease subunit